MFKNLNCLIGINNSHNLVISKMSELRDRFKRQFSHQLKKLEWSHISNFQTFKKI